jgi:hypothetical protein
MSKKRPRSRDPHSWIKDTKKKKGEESAPSGEGAAPPESAASAEEAAESPEAAAPEESAAAETADAEEEEETAEGEAAPPRSVVVEYHKDDGSIFAIHESADDTPEGAGEIESSVPDGKAAVIPLPVKMRDKTLLDIHMNYKVDSSKKKPRLVPKG